MIEERIRDQYTTVFKDWHIEDGIIGRGSQGKTAVFKITKKNSGFTETGALKIINIYEVTLTGNNDPTDEIEKDIASVKKNAETELATMNRMKGHGNIVSYHEFEFEEYSTETTRGVDLLIRMDFLENIGKLEKEGKTFSEEEIIRMGTDLSRALSDCHRKGILHRDIKPDNIFKNDYGYLLGDFGIAKYTEENDLVASTMAGTYPYVAPEQVKLIGSGKAEAVYDLRVDIYALGLSLYELANGNRIPFASSTYKRIDDIQRRLNGELLPQPGSVSPQLGAVILKACAFAPEDRYRNADEMLRAFEGIHGSYRDGDYDRQPDFSLDETSMAIGGYQIQHEKNICEKCGRELNEDAVFCPFCGHTVKTDAEIERPTPVFETEKGIGEMSVKEGSISEKGEKKKKKRRKWPWIVFGTPLLIFFLLLMIGSCAIRYGTGSNAAPKERSSAGNKNTASEKAGTTSEKDSTASKNTGETAQNEETAAGKETAGTDNNEQVSSQAQPDADKIAGTLMPDPFDSEERDDPDNGLTEFPVFGNDNFKRRQIKTIKFLSALPDDPEKKGYDISEKKDGSILAWFDDAGGKYYDMTIAADGTILLPENCRDLFGGYKNVVSIDFNGCIDTSNVTDMSHFFRYDESLGSVDVSGFDTGNVRDMTAMFIGCSSLKEVDVSGFDTRNVINTWCMFYGCSQLSTLDVSGFDTGNVEYMAFMFGGCGSLEGLDVSRFKTSQVKNVKYMFYGCSRLKALDVSGFDTGNVEDMSYMFADCESLDKLDVSRFNTSQVRNMEAMFSRCHGLTALDVGNFDTGNVEDMKFQFLGFGGPELDLSTWDFSSLKEANRMFGECEGLTVYLDDSKESYANMKDVMPTTVDGEWSEKMIVFKRRVSG